MRVGISCIAWDLSQDVEVRRLLTAQAVDAVDLVPARYFPDPAAAVEDEVRRVRDFWAESGIEVVGMQALLFGSSGFNLFGSGASRDGMARWLAHVCRIGGLLGARYLVFGSPRNRDRGTLSVPEATDVAVEFFGRLGDEAGAHGVALCLEPNPVRYNSNFMTTTPETAEVVRRVGHPCIRMQLDAGALAINAEDPGRTVAECRDIIGHVHASEPDLVALGDGNAPHAEIARALRDSRPDVVVSIEMAAPKAGRDLSSIERSLGVAKGIYGT